MNRRNCPQLQHIHVVCGSGETILICALFVLGKGRTGNQDSAFAQNLVGFFICRFGALLRDGNVGRSRFTTQCGESR